MTLYWLCLLLLCKGATGLTVPRDEVLSWVRLRVLEALGLEEPPMVPVPNGERGELGRRVLRKRAERGSAERPEEMQVILFPSSEAYCTTSGPGGTPFTLSFHPSIDSGISSVSSAQLWFFSGLGRSPNTSAPLYVLTPGHELFLASPSPGHHTADGWSIYELNQNGLQSITKATISLQIYCIDYAKAEACACRGRHLRWICYSAPLRMCKGTAAERMCSLNFYYCHGNCSSGERAAARLGIVQCCAPVPESMQSVRVTTTSDGGYSFKYETLPNLMPEECACI
uniref:TGF-beta family profile domain-containing protein n=1 Tax=Knipowitschia caucasica TaxID=637954 RepID=A0AAV2LE43_KNICA